MITYKPFKVADIKTIDLQPQQVGLFDYLKETDFICLETDTAITITQDGRNVFCGGCTTMWQGRGLMWCYFGIIDPKDFIKIHHIIHSFLSVLDFNRIEMYVDYDFKNGHRWAKALGFTVEAPRMRKFALDGKDQTMYSWIRE